MTAGAGTQAINMAQSAATQPFNLPVAPVAGFQPDQQQAFQQYRDLQGMAQPYYNQAQGYIASSAQPLSAGDINQYYNPMASNVLANLHESQGQQMHDLTGRLTQTAGGVGADRISVGQAELARQHSLAEGQTLSGLYQNALNAAQQTKQMQANAGYGMTNLGTTAQGAAIQGAGVLNQAGNQQQAQAQNVLNAPYQNQLARLAYPFQTAQYLAGITGGLSGALGGTTSGTGATTQPAPSIWSQLLGGAATVAGGLGASGAFGNSGWLTGNNYGSSGGNVYGGTPDQSGNIGYASGGATSLGNPTWMNADPTVPQENVSSQANSGARLDLNPKPSSQQSSGPSVADVAKIAMMFAKDGGVVSPDNAFEGYAVGGGPTFDERFQGSNPLTGMFMSDAGDQSFNSPLAQPANFADRFGGDAGGNMGEMSRGAALAHYMRNPDAIQATNDYANPDDVVNPGNPIRMDPQATQAWRDDSAPPVMAASDTQPMAMSASQAPTAPSPLAAPPQQNVSPSDYTSLDSSLPYPDLNPQADVSRGFAKSPWLALISAGAGMMSGTSPFAGVNIGKGLQEGVKTLQEQRKELATEQGVNQRAQQLMQQAQFHLDQYNKMTPYQQAEVANRKEQIEIQRLQANLKGWVPGAENMITGEKTFMKPSTGEVRVLKGDGTVVSGNINDPSSFTKTGQSGKETPLPKSEQPPPPMGQSELESDLKPPDNAINPSIYRKGSPALAQAAQEMKVVTALHAKEANNIGNEKLLLDNSKQAYGTLMKDGDQDGFLTKLATMRGNNVDERIRYARGLNEAARAAGKPPPINPDKIAAMEVISKDQKTLGMLFASNLSSREAFAGQQVGIESTPGLTQSPLGMLRLLAGYDAQLQYTQDKHAFFTNYVKKYGVATGWEQAFSKQNPPERYVVRSMMENLPNRRAAERLPEAVKILREHKNNPEVIKGFNRNYGNTASYWLTGKLDLLGAQ